MNMISLTPYYNNKQYNSKTSSADPESTIVLDITASDVMDVRNSLYVYHQGSQYSQPKYECAFCQRSVIAKPAAEISHYSDCFGMKVLRAISLLNNPAL